MIDLKALGFTTEELQERVVQNLTKQFLEYNCVGDGERAEGYWQETEFAENCRAQVKKNIDAAFEKIVDKYCDTSFLEKYLHGMNITKTNTYGEPKGDPMSFKEYLDHKAGEFLSEHVDWQGNPKSKHDSYSWTGYGTRIVWLVDQALQKHIIDTMNSVLTGTNQTIAAAIADSVKQSVAHITTNFNVSGVTKKK